jgi:hypothetical protein
MRSRKSPLECYRTLGLQPGASKKELRTAYLRLVKECHPDRFALNPEAQSVAQEKLKAVNEAYSFLRHYQPDGIHEVWTYPQGSTAQWREYRRRTSYEPPIADPYEGDYQYRPVGGSGKVVKFAWVFVALMVLNILRYTNFPSASDVAGSKNIAEASSRAASATNTSRPNSMQVVFLGEESRGDWASAKRLVPYFFEGSTKADVYRVQGIPDWSNEIEWRYGDSRVFFKGDGVQSWKSAAGTPLKVIHLGHADLGPADSGQAASGKALSVGATPADVLSIQGAPDSVSESYWEDAKGRVTKSSIWHYGASKIEFSEGKIIGWDNGAGSPLKVKD